MENFVVTISREYGSGGRIIGEAVAERLGFEFYNHNMIDMIAHESGLDKEYIEHWERQVSSPGIWGRFLAGYKGAFTASSFNTEYYYNMSKMFSVQSKIIENAAKEGSCVIVGRCADYILRKHKPVLHVFIHADKRLRAERIERDYGEEDALRSLETVDRGRKNYYAQNTGLKWGDYKNYDLALNSGSLGVEACVNLIAAAVESRRK